MKQMIDTVIIPAAGLGTRLFTVTKETPKEMIPLFYKTNDGSIFLKPLLEIIFENLFDAGFRNFCFIVGRGKESIENHFSPHYDFLDLLEKKKEKNYSKILSSFYKKIEKSSIVWIRQHVQKGIGPATLLAKNFVNEKPFLFHAGDLYIPNKKYLSDLINVHTEFQPSATIGLKKVKNPTRYGVATIKKNKGYFQIINAIEKPKNPPTNYALTGVNIFEPEIFSAIEKTKSGVNGEIQLTDSIQTMIKSKRQVYASIMRKNDQCIDIGVPETYHEALNYSYNHKIS